MNAKTMKLGEIMNNLIGHIQIRESVFAAIGELDRKGLDVLLVVHGKVLEGIITKGTILEKVVMKCKDPQKMDVGTIMDTVGKMLTVEDNILDAAKLLRDGNKEIVIVIKDKKVAGTISWGDIIDLFPLLCM